MGSKPRRIVAVAGALAVAGLAATGVIAGTATAAGTATCTANVNVRSEASASAPIVGVCERGDNTSAGAERDGFVELVEYGGWASAEYVATRTPSPQRTPGPGSADDSLTAPRSGDPAEPVSRSTSYGASPEAAPASASVTTTAVEPTRSPADRSASTGPAQTATPAPSTG
ncbi:hypothetical protein WIS52_04470 [Pseudonocardia nematodicida]|uniref:SH3 domain-containing protein n=1 Tax=Pseudonocardia nematodicida TaxID=1206997 RepID=A0ABV1K5I3_9PSEU